MRELRNYAPTYTPRLKLRYKHGDDIVHTTLRTIDGEESVAVSAFWELLLAMKSKMEPDASIAPLQFLSASKALVDSAVFLPYTLSVPLTGVSQVGASTAIGRASLCSFIGKGADGTRSTLYVPGLWFAPGFSTNGQNWRYEASEFADWTDIQEQLTALETSTTSPSGASVTFMPYINVSVWRRKVVKDRR